MEDTEDADHVEDMDDAKDEDYVDEMEDCKMEVTQEDLVRNMAASTISPKGW